jgi:cytochrome o ubiquinol oxidase subunit 2
MSRKNKGRFTIVLAFAVLLGAAFYLSSVNIPVLQPAGEVGLKERNLIYISLLLAVIVVVPVFIMLFLFSWKYHEGNKHAKYSPNFDSNRKLESIWWGVPFVIIFILSIITWNSSHDLDPFKPLSAASKPVNVQVVALQWKWLFIYPDYNVASVNFLQIPTHTPVNFEITSDAPMNSFWIPQLGGQIYAMSGMSTHLHLMADKPGNYAGRSANISGKGFSGMTFTTRAGSQNDFNNWLTNVRQKNSNLNLAAYNQLAQPSENNPASYYSSVDSDLYDGIVSKYIAPDAHMGHEHGMEM